MPDEVLHLKTPTISESAPTKWTFFLVVGELDDYAQQECNVAHGEFGDIYRSQDSSLSVHVRKWSNIIAGAKWRHNFYRDKLEIMVSKAVGSLTTRSSREPSEYQTHST